MKTDNYLNDLYTKLNENLTTNFQSDILPKNTMLSWDYSVSRTKHAIWSALTLLTEITLPVEIRYKGYQALLWYDTQKDSTTALPESISTEIRQLVKEMTFLDFLEEQIKIWERSNTAILLKFYTKVATLYDENEINNNLKNVLIAFTLKLKEYVFKTYGNLNIVQIANRLCYKK